MNLHGVTGRKQIFSSRLLDDIFQLTRVEFEILYFCSENK